MRLLSWTQDYISGIDAIDAAHQQLVDKINVLHEELDADEGARTVVSFFDALEAELQRHFRMEEPLMRSSASVERDDHQRDHARLLDEICDIAEAFDNAVEIDSVELAIRLESWFARHFRRHDSQLHNAVIAPQ